MKRIPAVEVRDDMPVDERDPVYSKVVRMDIRSLLTR